MNAPLPRDIAQPAAEARTAVRAAPADAPAELPGRRLEADDGQRTRDRVVELGRRAQALLGDGQPHLDLPAPLELVDESVQPGRSSRPARRDHSRGETESRPHRGGEDGLGVPRLGRAGEEDGGPAADEDEEAGETGPP